jgi:hypothetical protein
MATIALGRSVFLQEFDEVTAAGTGANIYTLDAYHTGILVKSEFTDVAGARRTSANLRVRWRSSGNVNDQFVQVQTTNNSRALTGSAGVSVNLKETAANTFHGETLFFTRPPGTNSVRVDVGALTGGTGGSISVWIAGV